MLERVDFVAGGRLYWRGKLCCKEWVVLLSCVAGGVLCCMGWIALQGEVYMHRMGCITGGRLCCQG